jgi:hypothetical protein
MSDSTFLSGLIGKPVRVVCKDPVDGDTVPVLTLREVSTLGIVGDGFSERHFVPWTEVVAISAGPERADEDDPGLAACADSEP